MDYEFVEHRGQGGFGIVDVVKNSKGLLFAKKTYRLSPLLAGDTALETVSKKRFIKEAKYQKQLNHKNIVPVLQEFLTEEPPFVIMPLAEASLNDDMQSGVVNKSNFMQVISDIMAGLEEIHNLGIYHRDLKPSNILRFKIKGYRDFYAISDFGLMSLKETSVTTLTSTGSTRNSDFYTAPEITIDLSAASIQSDIYSLGCLLHDFVGLKPARIPCAEINDPSEFSEILLGCTRVDPSRRFKNISSLRDALSSIEVKDIKPKSVLANEIVEILDEGEDLLNEIGIQRIVHYINTSTSDEDKNIILRKITLSHIEKIIEYPLLLKQIALAYCNWIRDTSFDFGECDTLCNRLMKIVVNSDVDVQSEGLMALLYMGTYHNRFYVERKVFNYFVNSLGENLSKRIAMEIRIDGAKANKAFKHLKTSIAADLSIFPELIQSAINDSGK